jgi:hypothetical protein
LRYAFSICKIAIFDSLPISKVKSAIHEVLFI